MLAQDAKDQTQSFDSPLPLVSGATIIASKDKTSASIAIAKQNRLLFANYWQFGITGTADSGDVPVFSEADGLTPGLKAKFGLGYSSFLGEPLGERDTQVDRFILKAWCFDVVDAVTDLVPDKFLGAYPDRSTAVCCRALLDSARAAVSAWAGSTEAPPAELATKIAGVLKVVTTVDVAGYTQDSVDTACLVLKPVEWAYKFCPNSGKRQPGENNQRLKYPALHASVVTLPERAWRFRVSANWTPSVSGLTYRPITNGVPDLATEKKWKGFLNGGSVDFSFHYKAFVAAAQVAYADKLDDQKTAPVEVCRTTTQGDFSTRRCKNAALGQPDPFGSFAVGGAVAVDPLLPGLGDSAFRPGAQLNARWERLADDKSRFLLSAPVYLARIGSPFDLVVGIRPSYQWMRGPQSSDKRKDFVVSLFVGARP